MLFYKDSYGIIYPTKVDMPWNKETKQNPIRSFITF